MPGSVATIYQKYKTMLDIKFIRQNLESVKKALLSRQEDPAVMENFLQHDLSRRDLLARTEELRHKRNIASDAIAELKKTGQEATGQIEEMRDVSAQIKVWVVKE